MGVFDYILSLSVKGSVLIAAVTAIRFFIKRYPKKYSYALWCVVFFSLAVQITLPAYFENPFNVPQQTVTETYEAITESYSGQVEFHHAGTAEYAQAVSQGVVPVQTQTENYVITAKDTLEQPKTIGETVLPKLHIVWMVGVVVLLVVYLKNVVDIISLLKFSVCCKNNIYYNEYIKTPFTFGLLKPKIYLPSDMDKAQERYVLSHEYAHISRLDHIVKPLCLMITILHWFNPLIWLAFGLMTKDMELSCDEKVIKSYEGQEKKDYCTALLNFALKDKPYKMSAVLFGESNCGQRIKNVLNFKQPKKIAVAVIVAVIAVVAVSTVATEADENIENNPQDKNETIYSTDSKPEFVPDYDVTKYDGLNLPLYYTAVDKNYFNDAVFIGDSIAEGLRVYTNIDNSLAEIADFVTMSNYSPYEFMQAELWTTSQSATGLEHTINFRPNKVYILMGTDALTFMDEKDFLAGYLDMVKALREALPDKDIYICSISPVRADFAASKPIFKSLGYINSHLENFAKDNGAYYLNLHEILADDSKYGWLKEEYAAVDGVHPNTQCYSDIIEYFRTHIVVKPDGLALEVDETLSDSTGTVQKEYTEDGIPVDEIKTYPGHIAVVPQEDVFVWPLNTSSGTSISCGFSDKFPEHDGVDIAGPLGTEIYAAADGVVVEAEYTTVGDGVYIVIEHSNGMKTLYAHCSELKAKAGDIVTAGQLIALMGSTGNSTGVHLHFEITDKNGVSVDPYRYW